MNESKIPKLLQEIPDTPKKLYMIGEFPDQEKNIFLTVIGSRKFTSYGKSVCEKLIAGLAGYPIVIVSGLALGMDGIAHRAALENNLTTIAIPGSGLDESVLYPASHKNLARDILKNGGCLISELEPQQKAAPWTFPQRNRIMAGLTKQQEIIVGVGVLALLGYFALRSPASSEVVVEESKRLGPSPPQLSNPVPTGPMEDIVQKKAKKCALYQTKTILSYKRLKFLPNHNNLLHISYV